MFSPANKTEQVTTMLLLHRIRLLQDDEINDEVTKLMTSQCYYQVVIITVIIKYDLFLRITGDVQFLSLAIQTQ